MINNKRLKGIGTKLESVSKHWNITVFIICVVFFFYILTLGINIDSEINRAPNIDDVNRKFSTVKIRKDVLSAIEKLFDAKMNHAAEYLQKPPQSNPFLPYSASSSETMPTSSISPSPNSSPFPAP